MGGFYELADGDADRRTTASASGSPAIQYTLDGSGTRSYTGPFPVPTDGPHTITFRSVDMTGLVETTKTLTFTNDATRAVLEGDALARPR